jgi:hypothetical protein
MIKIFELQNRAKLAEGRNNGMAFTILKKVKVNTYNTVLPYTCCKDFLNEVIFTEKVGINTAMYGLEYSKTSCFDTKHGYMGISMMNKHNDKLKYQEENCKILSENYKNLQEFINRIENMLNLPSFTIISPIYNPNEYLIKFPIFWAKYVYLISLYTLLLRIGFNYTNPDENPLVFLGNFKNGEDGMYCTTMLPKLKQLIEGNIPEQPMDKTISSNVIHGSYGIINYKF